MFGGQGGYTECKVERFPARVGLCAVVEDRLRFRSVGGRNRSCFEILRKHFGRIHRSCFAIDDNDIGLFDRP